MFKLVKNLFNLLSPSQRKRFYALQFLVIVTSILEILGVASIIPFIDLVGNMSQLEQNTFFAEIYRQSGIASESQFIFLVGLGVLGLLFVSMIISIFTTWRQSMFASKIGTEIADRLYTHYLNQDWLFHASTSSAQLTKKIATETMRITASVLVPLILINSKLILSVFMSIGVFLYDPKVALIGLSIFAIAYFILFRGFRKQLNKNGIAISKINEERFRLMNEGFGGIKDILLMGRNSSFIERFKKSGKTLAYSQGTNVALAQAPRYFVELIAFGTMISLILYLIASHNGNLGTILPILSVYALVIIKLLPSLQQIYSSMAIIKANIPAFESIQQDLFDSLHKESKSHMFERNCFTPKQNITLENITFTYPNKDEPALNKLDMRISVNNVIGIVGPSGSGKSTLIDILLGLIYPQNGHLKVDNKIINIENRRSWQNTIGFVPQSIFLSEGTIAENVAFGIPNNLIDFDQINQALEIANLSEFVKNLKNGINTKVGERGVQLSGGQRQRIGIARALYHNSQVLVLDEATSSLDGITEKMIMGAIDAFSGKKTIILVAHRLKTVQKCDQIFFIDKGNIVDQGTYQELIRTNKQFKNMSNLA